MEINWKFEPNTVVVHKANKCKADAPRLFVTDLCAYWDGARLSLQCDCREVDAKDPRTRLYRESELVAVE